MIKKNIGLLKLFAAITAIGSMHPASAQAPPAQRPSPYSPYLNLTRPGNVATNYYGLVRPDVDFRNSINNLQQQNYSLIAAANNPITAETPFPGTGHRASYMNYSHYYSLRGRAPYSSVGSFGAANAPGQSPSSTAATRRR